MAHDDKLSGQLLFDIANRLPGILKSRYLKSLDERSLNLKSPWVQVFAEIRRSRDYNDDDKTNEPLWVACELQ